MMFTGPRCEVGSLGISWCRDLKLLVIYWTLFTSRSCTKKLFSSQCQCFLYSYSYSTLTLDWEMSKSNIHNIVWCVEMYHAEIQCGRWCIVVKYHIIHLCLQNYIENVLQNISNISHEILPLSFFIDLSFKRKKKHPPENVEKFL